MKLGKVLIGCFVMLVAMHLNSFAQGRQESSRGDGGSTRGASTAGAGAAIVGSPGVMNGSADSSPRQAAAYSPASGGSRTGGSGFAYAPSLQGTSFSSVLTYLSWQDFYFHLQTQYPVNDRYFSRFYRNSEPLITPLLLRLIMTEPVNLSREMTVAVDQLQFLLTELEAGRPVKKEEIATQAERVRSLAKKIRQDQSVMFFDQRKDKDILKGVDCSQLGLGAIKQLREMVTDLNTQLKSTYSQNSTATISVNTLNQPSFESLSKAIEKLSRVIENSAHRI